MTRSTLLLLGAFAASAFAAPPDYRRLEAAAEAAALKPAYAEAQSLYTSALEAARLSAGPQHPDTGRILSRLALMIEMQGDLSAAEPHYRHAIQILEAPALASPSDLATALELYAGLRTRFAKSAEAEKLRDRARPIRLRQVRELVNRVPPAAESEHALKIAAGVSPPVVLTKVEPQYSPVARIAKLQGTALFKIVIGVDGRPRGVELLRGIGLGLDEQAVEALLQWRFTPAAKDGQAVPVLANIEINFRLL